MRAYSLNSYILHWVVAVLWGVLLTLAITHRLWATLIFAALLLPYSAASVWFDLPRVKSVKREA